MSVASSAHSVTPCQARPTATAVVSMAVTRSSRARRRCTTRRTRIRRGVWVNWMIAVVAVTSSKVSRVSP